MIQNNGMDEAAEVSDLGLKRAGVNKKQYKNGQTNIGLMANVVRKENSEKNFTSCQK
jgi:hypothetical protein